MYENAVRAEWPTLSNASPPSGEKNTVSPPPSSVHYAHARTNNQIIRTENNATARKRIATRQQFIIIARGVVLRTRMTQVIIQQQSQLWHAHDRNNSKIGFWGLRVGESLEL